MKSMYKNEKDVKDGREHCKSMRGVRKVKESLDV